MPAQKPKTKDGLISQRVPSSTEKQFRKLANKAKLPPAICLQLMVEAEYERVFSTKS